MARKREGRVRESLSRLRTLGKEYAGTPHEQHLMMLQLLKQDPDRSIEDVAERIGCSSRTIKRWWKVYQEQGLDLLVGLPQRPTDSRKNPDDLAELTDNLLNNRITTRDQVRRWLDEHEAGDI